MDVGKKSYPEMRPPLAFLRRYILAVALLNLGWEIVQLPLYTLWQEQSMARIAYAVLHCTLGDVIIATVALIGSVLILGNSSWPRERYGRVAAAAIVAGLAYTSYSESLNVFVRRSWSYADSMPILPIVGLGLSPLLQWLIIPGVVLRIMRPV